MSTVTLLNTVVVSVETDSVFSNICCSHCHFYTTGVLALVYSGRVSNSCAECHVCKEHCAKSFEKVNSDVIFQL